MIETVVIAQSQLLYPFRTGDLDICCIFVTFLRNTFNNICRCMSGETWQGRLLKPSYSIFFFDKFNVITSLYCGCKNKDKTCVIVYIFILQLQCPCATTVKLSWETLDCPCSPISWTTVLAAATVAAYVSMVKMGHVWLSDIRGSFYIKQSIS